uniref:Putative ring finger n=1 Tax=Culex tarsalis TaxID=7177 RepID=A0A1Q3EVS5_CULTA
MERKRKIGSSSNTSLAAPSCRYNLRNRGPAPFAKMAEQECPICLSSVYEAPVVLNCEHTICGPCVKRLLVKYKTCPICNTVLIRQLFLNDTSYTRKLTTRNRSPVKPVATRSAVRAVKSEPPSVFVKDEVGAERMARKRRLQDQDKTPERSTQQQSVTMVLCITPLARPEVNRTLARVVN